VTAGLLIGLAVWFASSARTAAQRQGEPAAGSARFDGKFVVLNFHSAAENGFALLMKFRAERLNGRDFLVGEYAVADPTAEAEADFAGVEVWFPSDRVDNFRVYDDRAKAVRSIERAAKKATGN
jgi:hypothetical protein